MIISTQTAHLDYRLGMEKTIRIIANAGFDAYDISIFDTSENNPMFTDGWRDYVDALKQTADAAGIVCNQAHAPFPSSRPDMPEYAEYNSTIRDNILRAMEVAALLGAKTIVVHPVHHLKYWENEAELYKMNLDFYRSLAPAAKQFGIQIALENMFQRNGTIVDSVCARVDEFISLLDELNDDCFTACLDLGHCGLCGHDAAEMIRALGKDRLTSLHIHDNDYESDLHTLPYTREMKWDTILAALRDIGYDGDFTYEADSFLAGFPTSFLPEVSAFMAKLARHMVAEITL